MIPASPAAPALRALTAGWVLLVATGITARAQDWTLERVEVHHRFASEVASSARAALSPDGTLVVDERTNSLLIRDTPAAIALVREVVAAIDVRPVSVILTLRSTDRGRLEERLAEVRWGVRDGDVAVGAPAAPATDGIHVGLVLRADELRSTGRAHQTLRVLSGGEGLLSVGGTQAFAGHDGTLHGSTTTFRDFGRSIRARPTVLPDGSIRIALDAGTSGPVGAGGVGEASRATTTVVLQPGESVVIGGVDESAQQAQRSPLRGGGSRSESRSSVLVLSARVDE